MLDLSHNRIESLPEGIGAMTELEVLNMDSNQLSTLPNSLGSCGSMAVLDLSRNALEAIPEALSDMKQLRNFMLDGNRYCSAQPRKVSIRTRENLEQ